MIYEGRGRGEVEASDDFVLRIYQEYSFELVTDLLLPTGLLTDKNIQYSGSFEKFIFLKGNTSEVYSKSEIDFIESLGDVYVFENFYKKARKGLIPCRVIATKIKNVDILSAAIAFTKIINKAFDGFNIGFIISDNGILFTGRLFEKDNNIECFISNLIRTEEQYDEIVAELIFGSLYDSFVEYYSYIKDVLHYTQDIIPYEETLKKVNIINYRYIEELQTLEKQIGVSFAKEIERTFFADIKIKDLPYCEKVKECEECLFKIESSRVNTMEILFAAEEMERFALEAEQKSYEMVMQSNIVEDEETIIDEEIKEILDDPEQIIKMLKNKKRVI